MPNCVDVSQSNQLAIEPAYRVSKSRDTILRFFSLQSSKDRHTVAVSSFSSIISITIKLATFGKFESDHNSHTNQTWDASTKSALKHQRSACQLSKSIFVKYLQLLLTLLFSITLDAVVSVVTVTKLTKVEVKGNCYCPGKLQGGASSAL